jgi:hypothetical protein
MKGSIHNHIHDMKGSIPNHAMKGSIYNHVPLNCEGPVLGLGGLGVAGVGGNMLMQRATCPAGQCL